MLTNHWQIMRTTIKRDATSHSLSNKFTEFCSLSLLKIELRFTLRTSQVLDYRLCLTHLPQQMF